MLIRGVKHAQRSLKSNNLENCQKNDSNSAGRLNCFVKLRWFKNQLLQTGYTRRSQTKFFLEFDNSKTKFSWWQTFYRDFTLWLDFYSTEQKCCFCATSMRSDDAYIVYFRKICQRLRSEVTVIYFFYGGGPTPTQQMIFNWHGLSRQMLLMQSIRFLKIVLQGFRFDLYGKYVCLFLCSH